VVWHVRPGIYWQGLNQGRRVMEDRELIAADVVADLLYYRTCPGGASFNTMTEADGIYTTGKYDLVIETPKGPDFTLMYLVGYEDRAAISPPEIEGSDSWADQIGTGPFMLKKYVVGSHMIYERNPNYWDTTTIDGVEYQLPFIDELIFPIIPDESTQIAALRTGEIDFYSLVPPVYWPTLNETAGLLSAVYTPYSGRALSFNLRMPPVDNTDLRRALMVGTDMEAAAALQGVGPLPKHWFPQYTQNPDTYIPLEELPADIRILYDYDPELASQMVIDAGFPDGVDLQVHCDSSPAAIDFSSMLKDMWEKIGVRLEIKSYDTTTYGEMVYKGTYRHFYTELSLEVGNPIATMTRFGLSTSYLNFGGWKNERFDELVADMVKELDVAERNRLVKEASLIILRDVAYLPVTPIASGGYWWPWLKNYYAESNVQDFGGFCPIPVVARIWIDEDLKTEMGY